MNAKVARALNSAKTTVKKYSPEILTGVAIISGVAGAVWACKKTLDLNEEIAPVMDEIDGIKDCGDEELDKKALTNAYVKAGKIVIKHYAGPVGLGIISISSSCAACGISRKTYNSIAAAAAIMSEKFHQYRENVIEDQGVEKDYMYYNNLKKEVIEEVEEDPETGKKKKVKKEVYVNNGKPDSLSIEFGPSNPNYKESPALNRAFLMGVEEYANVKYCSKDVDDYFMDEIFEGLGFTKDQLNKKQREAARIMGWSKKQNPNGVIRIGIFDKINERANDAADNNDGRGEPVFILTFNVDGIILDDYISID